LVLVDGIKSKIYTRNEALSGRV